MITYDFSNRTAVVTGAGGGMGFEIANMLLDAGGSVVMIDVKAEPSGLNGTPDQRFYAQGDLTDTDFVEETIQAGAKRFGGIHYLANVAGVLWFEQDASLLEMDLDVWDRVFDINLKSMVRTARAVVPHMQRAGGGAMVHFSSTQCLRGDPLPQDAYSTAKAGVAALSRSLAMQLAGENIRSNTIYPGLTQTPLQARWDTPEKIRDVGGFVPMGRIGTPQELAAVAVFLLSDGASYVTGADLVVDGGLLLK
ncbi:2-(R)-hydroxypropyl-CoM dehydrogenase [Roseovarius litorisediminis]|uniref:2-(R)-hydroxypropyl-CoM dehydrogenase n=1 Tax=Roseovarius litorisediminis TaxID=1312363 RepID=A0A1Y5RB17_9RHOB|nr:SDR family oxidoreductase [Roseovarius litorisediminis]SLN12527.1 2-(R)-hydroxypropyl-CoM dehydrogenase [Roseovarius litorisediminis]